MRKTPEQTRFERELCARTKELRERLGWSAEEMASMLRIPAERYRKYESRSPMPQYLLPTFAAITQRPVEYVLTGRWHQHFRSPEDILAEKEELLAEKRLMPQLPALFERTRGKSKQETTEEIIRLVLKVLKEIRT